MIIKLKSDLGCQTLKATQFVAEEISKGVIQYHDLTMRQAGRLNPPPYKWGGNKELMALPRPASAGALQASRARPEPDSA